MGASNFILVYSSENHYFYHDLVMKVTPWPRFRIEGWVVINYDNDSQFKHIGEKYVPCIYLKSLSCVYRLTSQLTA